MIDQRIAAVEQVLGRCPYGQDVNGVWEPWAHDMTIAVLTLIAEIRGAQYRFQHQAEIDAFEARLSAFGVGLREIAMLRKLERS
jgi:hypothetical protein